VGTGVAQEMYTGCTRNVEVHMAKNGSSKREAKRELMLRGSKDKHGGRGAKDVHGINTRRTSAADRPKRSLTKNARRKTGLAVSESLPFRN
jgi:hypothetical protein